MFVLQVWGKYMGIVLNYCQYGVLYLGSYSNTGPYINFPHFGHSNLGKLSYTYWVLGPLGAYISSPKGFPVELLQGISLS